MTPYLDHLAKQWCALRDDLVSLRAELAESRAAAERHRVALDQQHEARLEADTRERVSVECVLGQAAMLEALRADLAEARQELESAHERLRADPHNAKALGERVAELLAELAEERRKREEAESGAYRDVMFGEQAQALSDMRSDMRLLERDRDKLREALLVARERLVTLVNDPGTEFESISNAGALARVDVVLASVQTGERKGWT